MKSLAISKKHTAHVHPSACMLGIVHPWLSKPCGPVGHCVQISEVWITENALYRDFQASCNAKAKSRASPSYSNVFSL